MFEKFGEIAAEKIIPIISGLVEFVLANFEWSHGWNAVAAWGILALSILITIFLIIKGLRRSLELLLAFSEEVKKNPPAFLATLEQQRKVRRRSQFCAVLDSDLAHIAKSENWNDQYFTDLEAEVETEGGYYSTKMRRILKRKSFGIRRVSSLMAALESTAEKTVLLVGEPGSGKSVALRHLAKQLATKGKHSKRANEMVPLYLNLRELEVAAGEEIDANLIKKFVIDNIRRGDADTSDYVKENWNEFKEDGVWCFLFDSFDEIPQILHSATGSDTVKKYSEAIRKFLSGMGDCKAILASREYKGPEALPWEKFRILPLGFERQRELVSNSFLKHDQMELVFRHLAEEASKVGNNPLFLTLLCRYVKDTGQQPVNDHQLLSSHIDRLAHRDPEYIRNKYNLDSAELLDGARRLAVLLATNPGMSLAPKVDEIIASIPGADADYITRIIHALIDVKIGRNDVSSAGKGDSRFTFVHRRYQETIFSNFLAGNPDFIEPEELLSNPTWREYTVTLLQTQEIGEISYLIEAAMNILNGIDNRPKVSGEVLDIAYAYFDWESDNLANLLAILQEGFSRRTLDVPLGLRTTIQTVLATRWNNGDHIDKKMVIQLGGLLPSDTLSAYLETCFSEELFTQAAFSQCVFLEKADGINEFIQDRLAKAVLSADSIEKRLRIQALAARLPLSVGANHIVKRCLNIRPFLDGLSKITSAFLLSSELVFNLTKRSTFLNFVSEEFRPRKNYTGGNEWLVAFLLPIVFLFAIVLSVEHGGAKTDGSEMKQFVASSYLAIKGSNYFWIACSGYIALIVFLMVLYSNRSLGGRINWFSRKTYYAVFVKEGFLTFPLILILTCVLVYAMGWVGGYVLSLFNIGPASVPDFLRIGMPVMLVLSIATIQFEMRKRRRNDRAALDRLNCLIGNNAIDRSEKFVLYANSFEELVAWIRDGDAFRLGLGADSRLLSSISFKLPIMVEKDENSCYAISKSRNINGDLDFRRLVKVRALTSCYSPELLTRDSHP
ncbi:NACHT domain-containing protein [Duganella sp. CF458]|uniref:NACHT domain-containing protein n=1 Tax=Duganella sp. CF458 TaxID=1884368 RepID=UPI0008EE6BB1|nr:NACHT domain-containing protein [Duganella sp. CF458]SFG30207.1 NACHT domain-containing protein [Duganella sp. CF458]